MASTREEADIDSATSSGNPLIDGLLGEFYWSKLAQENFQFTMPDEPGDYRATRDGLVDDYPDYLFSAASAMPVFMQTNIRLAIDTFNEVLPFAITEQGDNDVDTQLRYGFTIRDPIPYGVRDSEIANVSVRWPEDDGLGSEQENWMSGDIFLRTGQFKAPEASDTHGTRQYFAILHLTGHALGLKHGDVAEDGFDPLPSSRDSLEFTVMTSRRFVGDTKHDDTALTTGNFPQTMMMLDIQALQYLYGADYDTRRGNTTYSWNTDGSYLINGSKQWLPSVATIFMTIWDGGGIDTYDFSSFDSIQAIDLAPGGWSNIGAHLADLGKGHFARGNVFNALQYQSNSQSLIENAIGGSGNDTIRGYYNNNSLKGGPGNDDLLGHEGDDTLNGGAGGDLINGGSGNDVAVYASPDGETVTLRQVGLPEHGNWSVSGPEQAADDVLTKIEAFLFGNGADRVTLADATTGTPVTIDGGGGNDTIIGSNDLTDKDYLIGNSGSDRIVVRRGVFEAYGGVRTKDGGWIERPADNDLLVLDRSEFDGYYSFGRQNDPTSPLGIFYGIDGSMARGTARLYYRGSDFVDDIRGGIGNDTIVAGGGDDNLVGGLGDDVLEGGSGRDNLSGEEGNDTILGGPGDGTYGYDGNDLLIVPGGSALGGMGSDTISGGGGGESFYGNEGNDILIGNGGEDILSAGDGRDIIRGGAGADFVTGGDGIDEASYAESNAAVAVNLALTSAKGGHAAGDRIDSIENLRGSPFDDALVGDESANDLIGLGGKDRLTGAQGNDRLQGDGGADIFRYPAKTFGHDTIVDFQDGVDKISLVGSGLNFASFTEARSGQNTVLSVTSAPVNTIMLLNILPSDISSADFLA